MEPSFLVVIQIIVACVLIFAAVFAVRSLGARLLLALLAILMFVAVERTMEVQKAACEISTHQC